VNAARRGILLVIFDLLERTPQEVAGCGSPTISRELRKKLAKLAADRCTDEERRELIRLLEQQPDLIPALAREIKILRESPK
jgi:hypothetical protein